MQAEVTLSGLLGEAIAASRNGRLFHFITDERSPAIAIFDRAAALKNLEGDWYGEHAGKWLVAAAKAAARSGDATLKANVMRVTDHLIAQQEPDGYLGTYARERRFMWPQPPKPGSWDGAPSLRTWDIWTHSYLILGLVEVHRQLAHPNALASARRIGDLCWRTLTEDGIDICELGNHHGLSATVLMDPAVELYNATQESRYLALAERVLAQANANPELALLPRALSGADAAEIATGKAYQLCWNLVGLAKLQQASGLPEYRTAVESLWNSIRTQHLTLGGGPWGGVAHRSREVFNAPGSFSPHAYVETCSTLAWIQLNRELLAISGDARYAEEIERSAYNDLLGAMAVNGEDWCYYSHPNGARVHTTYWRCCKSSGAMAMEELPGLAYRQLGEHTLQVNLYGPGCARFTLGGGVTLEQTTAYPYNGEVRISVAPRTAMCFSISLRIPSWAQGASVRINGNLVDAVPGHYSVINRRWQPGDTIALEFPMQPVLRRHALQNTQESRAPDGSLVRQQVLNHEYIAITRGPLVYATGLIDGFKTEETVRLPNLGALTLESGEPPVIRLHPEDRAPIDLEPYFCAGGRADGAWRLTWLSLAPRPAPVGSRKNP